MDDNKLGTEYEQWLDSINETLPLPVPNANEEEDNGETKDSTADIHKISKS